MDDVSVIRKAAELLGYKTDRAGCILIGDVDGGGWTWANACQSEVSQFLAWQVLAKVPLPIATITSGYGPVSVLRYFVERNAEKEQPPTAAPPEMSLNSIKGAYPDVPDDYESGGGIPGEVLEGAPLKEPFKDCGWTPRKETERASALDLLVTCRYMLATEGEGLKVRNLITDFIDKVKGAANAG
jgi:hypothetical protein